MNIAPKAIPLTVGPEGPPASASASASTSATKGVADKRSLEAAREFEAVFLSQMVSLMFSGLGSSGMFSGGNGEETFRTILYQEFGKAIAKAGGVGITDAVTREILKYQEVATP